MSMEITPINKLLIRLKELDGNTRFSTQYDCFELWVRHFVEIEKNIDGTSLNAEDRTLRRQQLMDQILLPSAKHEKWNLKSR